MIHLNKYLATIICLLIVQEAITYKNAIFYCGFSIDFCGQSKINDVNPSIDTIILAFSNTLPDGKVIVDQQNYPAELTTQWKKSGKTILISVGGERGNWTNVFANQNSINNFINSLYNIVQKFRLDGVDLDIEDYATPPKIVAGMIIKLKLKLNQLGRKLIVVSPQNINVYQGAPVPDPDIGGQDYNYFVPVINLADSYIDFYQPQAYNNEQGTFTGGSLQFFKDVYLNWRNLQGLSPKYKPIPNFIGVKPEKLRIGLMASRTAGDPIYYGQPSTIQQFKNFLKANNYPLNGFMMWDSNWDKLNFFAISNVCAA